ncbi:MAG: hypothetical protein RMJ51_02220 [Candidatus Calescibacterium sp.]|nr:hypothetical protein [Candidatus Calescibacterium sp.]MCX7971856.1 hypothetical protein [bacterium]MDW8195045.1 hypothetical protein [Candidatus Calescibacterium sp.]
MYVELLKTNIQEFIKENLSDLHDFYEGKYKVIRNERTDTQKGKVYVLEYTFVQLEEEYRTVKYFLELGENYYLGLYCLGPSREFPEVYNDFIKVFESMRKD